MHLSSEHNTDMLIWIVLCNIIALVKLRTARWKVFFLNHWLVLATARRNNRLTGFQLWQFFSLWPYSPPLESLTYNEVEKEVFFLNFVISCSFFSLCNNIS